MTEEHCVVVSQQVYAVIMSQPRQWERGEKKACILRLRAAGVPYKVIAHQANCSEGYVSAVLQRAKYGGRRPYDDKARRK